MINQADHELWNKAVAIRELEWDDVPYLELLGQIKEILTAPSQAAAMPPAVQSGEYVEVHVEDLANLKFEAKRADQIYSGTHEIFEHPDQDRGLQGDKPFCRFSRYYDSGDASVGIPSTEMWVLAEDQSGTELADLLERK